MLAARTQGATAAWNIRKHLLPNVLPQMLIVGSYEFGQIIVMEASLSYLGLGVQPPLPSWGMMVSEGQSYLALAPSLSIIPEHRAVRARGRPPVPVPGASRPENEVVGVPERVAVMTPAAAPATGTESSSSASASCRSTSSRLSGRDAARRRCFVRCPRERGLRDRRRVRLGQEPDDACRARAPVVTRCRFVSGTHRAARPGAYRALELRGRCARCAARRWSIVFQDPMTSLNPVLRIGTQIAEAVRGCINPDMTRQEIKRPGASSCSGLVGIPQPRAALSPVPARVLGRHAAARGDRHRDGERAGRC